jgi:hypothetical protein
LARFAWRFVVVLARLPFFVTLDAKALTLMPAAFAFFVNAPGCLIAPEIH